MEGWEDTCGCERVENSIDKSTSIRDRVTVFPVSPAGANLRTLPLPHAAVLEYWGVLVPLHLAEACVCVCVCVCVRVCAFHACTNKPACLPASASVFVNWKAPLHPGVVGRDLARIITRACMHKDGHTHTHTRQQSPREGLVGNVCVFA